ncbi:hypothetical protein [Sulfurimonas sp.]|uniref:tetratricopeptide repeat protein n=1 Tax=Sulfurimonas sp. TaxID=2022749 RepID=UPI002AAFFF8E|nr:hypothetical protein [Sulfurimonas sp.]
MLKTFFLLSLLILSTPQNIYAKEAYFPSEKKLVDECHRDYSTSCVNRLAQLRFKYAVKSFIYIKKTENLLAVELPLMYAESAVELNPQESKYWTLLGEIYSSLHSDAALTLSEGALIEALELDSSNNKARLLLASIMYSQERFFKSSELILEAIERDNSLLTRELAESLALIYLIDNNTQKGLESFLELKEETNIAFLNEFIKLMKKVQ